jgi:hypothetical protein
MATAQDLMGLGMPSQLARLLGTTPVQVSAAGTSVGDAPVIGVDRKCTILIAGTSSASGAAIGTVGADSGPLLGDEIWVSNVVGGNITIYAKNNAQFMINGLTTSGGTGITLTSSQSVFLKVLTASVIAGIRASV